MNLLTKLRGRATALARDWTVDVPPHSYALLRIVLGFFCVINLAGLLPVGMYWPLDALTPLSQDGAGPRPWLLAHGLGTVAGWAFFLAASFAYSAMMVGFFSDAAVLASFAALVAQTHWNNLPLSSAHQVLIVLTFCLLWSETGRVWSLDALRRRQPADRNARVPVWPLLLIRCQVALVYGSSGLYKLAYPVWRDGSAVYWALNLNSFHRFPWVVPESLAPLLAVITWSTLLFELLFPFLVWFKRTRRLTLLAGVALHVGLWLTLELGPFSWVMIGSYLSFLDPERVPALFTRGSRRSLVEGERRLA